MQWKIRQSKLSGTVAVPPSKSHTIRAFLVAGLARGASTVRRPLLDGDGLSAYRALISLGAETSIQDSVVTVRGLDGNVDGGAGRIDCGNSGTSLNLFTSAAALGGRPRTFDGDSSLRLRPVAPLLDALGQLGVSHTRLAGAGDVPFEIRGPLKGGRTTVNGVSSQFVSSLLLACPLAPGDTHIHVENLHERPYIDVTLWWLDRQKIAYEASPDHSVFIIKGGQHYTAFDETVPGDFSSATFPAVAAAITYSRLSLTGIDFSDPQGDKGIFELLRRFGADTMLTNNGVSISTPRSLRGRTIDLNAMPDALPAFAVLGCAALGVTRIGNVAQARIKETDRLRVMTEELTKMGAAVTETADGLEIKQSDLKGAQVSGHGDHRVVMALALAGMIAEGETVIDTAESAAVTYPTFVQDFRSLGAKIEVVE